MENIDKILDTYRMIQGNVFLMCVSENPVEIINQYAYAQTRLDELYALSMERLEKIYEKKA